MLLELIGAYFIFLIALFIIAEYSQKLSLGLIASVFIFPLAFWILVDDIQIGTGIVETYSGYTEINTTSTTTDNTTISSSFEYPYYNITKTQNYSNIPQTPGMPLNQALGIVGILLGLFGTFHYVLRIMDTK